MQTATGTQTVSSTKLAIATIALLAAGGAAFAAAAVPSAVKTKCGVNTLLLSISCSGRTITSTESPQYRKITATCFNGETYNYGGATSPCVLAATLQAAAKNFCANKCNTGTTTTTPTSTAPVLTIARDSSYSTTPLIRNNRLLLDKFLLVADQREDLYIPQITLTIQKTQGTLPMGFWTAKIGDIQTGQEVQSYPSSDGTKIVFTFSNQMFTIPAGNAKQLNILADTSPFVGDIAFRIGMATAGDVNAIGKRSLLAARVQGPPVWGLIHAGNFSVTTSTTSTVPTCTDEDGGKKVYTFGNVTLSNASGVHSSPDICAGTELREYYCTGDTNQPGYDSFTITCPYGCSNGACVPSGSTNSCYDSGDDINSKGFVISSGGSVYFDSCPSNSPTKVWEMTCKASGGELAVAKDCLSGTTCSDGACSGTPTQTSTAFSRLIIERIPVTPQQQTPDSRSIIGMYTLFADAQNTHDSKITGMSFRIGISPTSTSATSTVSNYRLVFGSAGSSPVASISTLSANGNLIFNNFEHIIPTGNQTIVYLLADTTRIRSGISANESMYISTEVQSISAVDAYSNSLISTITGLPTGATTLIF